MTWHYASDKNVILHLHLSDAFIQSDLHCIQVTVSTFYQHLLSLGIEPMILALLAPCSTSWATGKLRDERFYSREPPDYYHSHSSRNTLPLQAWAKQSSRYVIPSSHVCSWKQLAASTNQTKSLSCCPKFVMAMSYGHKQKIHAYLYFSNHVGISCLHMFTLCDLV